MKRVELLLKDPSLALETKLKLVLLYALRYEKQSNNSIAIYVEALRTSGASESFCDTVAAFMLYGGSDVRMDVVSSVESMLLKTQNVFKGLKGVENVYTQHTSRLNALLQDVAKGKLSPQNYPFFEGGTKDRVQDLVVFMVGGVTYQEALEVSRFNAIGNGIRVVLGGTSIHSSKR